MTHLNSLINKMNKRLKKKLKSLSRPYANWKITVFIPKENNGIDCCVYFAMLN